MNIAADRTNSLQRMMVAIDTLVPNDLNPNEMNDQEFNLLYDNVERMGITDPILVRPLDTPQGDNGEIQYRIIGGYHRWEIGKLHGLTQVPITVVTDPTFDDDQEKFQIVRHNIIHGKMSPKKFMALYESMSEKYSDEVAAESFGFANQEEFKKLITQTGKDLPKEMQKAFKDASKDIKTIDDLALVLNRLFSTYGETVPQGYMIFDYGGQDHVWLRMEKKQKASFLAFAEHCKQKGRSPDAVVTVILQLIADDKFTPQALAAEVEKLPAELVSPSAGQPDLPPSAFAEHL